MSTRWKSFAQTSWDGSQSPSSTSPSAAQTSPTAQFYHLALRQLHLSLVSILEFVQSFTTLPLTSPICHYSVFWHTTSFLPLHLTSSICHFFQQGFSASLGFLISFIERKSKVYEIRLPWNWTCNWIIPDICHGRHGRRLCKFFLAGVSFYRFNAKNWHFWQILREKVAFFYRFNAKNWHFSV